MLLVDSFLIVVFLVSRVRHERHAEAGEASAGACPLNEGARTRSPATPGLPARHRCNVLGAVLHELFVAELVGVLEVRQAGGTVTRFVTIARAVG